MRHSSLCDEAAEALLRRLDYCDGSPGLTQHRASLLLVAARFARIFVLRAPEAPNLVVLGADVDPSAFGLGDGPVGHVAGTGLTFREAFEGCVGEGVEYASAFAPSGDRLRLLPANQALARAPVAWLQLWERLAPYRRCDGTEAIAWADAANLADGEPVCVPADLCFRRPANARDLDIPWPLSTGTGAGTDPLDATVHGLLELIERDAVALWWRGGRPARPLPDAAGYATLAHLRGGESRRRTWLLDITSDVGVPVVVAASCNDDGFGLCCGFAARPTLDQAAAAAVREMAQMELAHHLSEAKRQMQGEDRLSGLDRQHIERFTRIDVRRTKALHPIPPPGPSDGPVSGDGSATLASIRRNLETLGLSACVLDLTRQEIGVPAVRALCPGLEIGLAAPPGPRLLAEAARWGGDPAAIVPL